MSSPFKIVVAEDEDADVMLLKHALGKARLDAQITFARDGQETIDSLRSDDGTPVLLLLDLHMPKVDGFEVLRWLREHAPSRKVSVVILSASGETEDIKRAGALGAKAYIVKPDDPFELCRIIGRVQQFWETSSQPEPTPAGRIGR
jgi:CheY-like chemotaxis protein